LTHTHENPIPSVDRNKVVISAVLAALSVATISLPIANLKVMGFSGGLALPSPHLLGGVAYLLPLAFFAGIGSRLAPQLRPYQRVVEIAAPAVAVGSAIYVIATLLNGMDEMTKRAVADLVPYPLASEIIGFATWEWRELVGNDVIRAFSQFADGSMYLRKDIENVVGRMIRKATVSDSMTISIRTYARHNRMTVGNVLMCILDGQLAAARGCGKQRGLRNLRIVASNRRQRSARLLSDASVQNAMTVADAAIILRLHHEVVALLVRDGRLEKAHGGMVARSSVMDFHARYANGQLYRPALGCANSEVRDRLSKIGVSVECLGDRVANVVVLREAARRALELEFDPDDRHVARNVLWEEFRTLASVRCPVFTVPPTVPEVGVKLRTATRKIAVSASVDRSSGAVSLTFDLHPELTGRRWKLFEKSEADVRQALGFMSWNKMADDAGWRLSWVAEDLVGVRLAVDALVGMHRWFK
jgi:hypothetical protein